MKKTSELNQPRKKDNEKEHNIDIAAASANVPVFEMAPVKKPVKKSK